MTTTTTELDLRVIERVLEMGSGYVLDFSDRTFAGFFGDFGVDIGDPRFSGEGTSKAKRLRSFLRLATPPLTGRVLAELLKHRLLNGKEPPTDADRTAFAAIVARLGGAIEPAPTVPSEDELLKLVFQPKVFDRLPVDDAMSKLLVARMEEASRCVESQAYLAAIILSGSVLEGMCLGYGGQHPEAVNRGYATQYAKPAPQFNAWKLSEWIDVLGRTGVLSQTVVKFGHALRDFRNYVHPAEQLVHRFEPDRHTARIGFQVVVAAAEDLTKGVGDGQG